MSMPLIKRSKNIMKKLAGLLHVQARSFRQKIIFTAVPILILTSLSYTFDSVRTERAIMRENIVKQAKVITDLASHISELPLISKNQEIMEKAANSLKAVPEVSFVAFYDTASALLFKDGIIPEHTKHPEHSAAAIIEEDDYFDLHSPVFSTKAEEDIDIFQETLPGNELNEIVGWVRIGFSKSFMKQSINKNIYRSLIIALIFIAASTFLVYKLTAALTRPLTSLSNAVQSVRKGHYPEISISSGDEIGMLTVEFNRMSRTIKDREELLLGRMQLSAFVADIGMILTQSEELETILKNCTRMIINHFDSLLTRIWLYNTKEETLELKASSGLYTIDNSPVKIIKPGMYQAGMIAKTLKPCYSNKISNINADDSAWAARNNITSFAGYPLIVDGQLVGVMEMFNQNIMFDDVFYTLESVANEIALSIQHKLAEWKVQESLKEKEVLLREIHHRVKNNMQVISSLLNIQSDYIEDERYLAILNDSKNRIKSMAIVHEKLYQSNDMANINFGDYITTLANSLMSFYETASRHIALSIDAEDVSLGVDTAIPCGLLLNELLSNCMKHAFPDNRKGIITVTLKTVNSDDAPEYLLVISDNGIGIPEGMNIRETSSLGLQLVTTLVEHQLQGKIDLTRTDGTTFNIRFKDISYTKRI